MKIVPTRTHRLGGRRVEAGKAVEVSDDDARLALRHGWAVEAPAKRGTNTKAEQQDAKPADPAKDDGAEPSVTDAEGDKG